MNPFAVWKSHLEEQAKSKEVEQIDEIASNAQILKNALARHEEHALAANKAGDHEKVIVHQKYMNNIKKKLGLLAKIEDRKMDQAIEDEKKEMDEEVEQIDEKSDQAKQNKTNKNVRDVVRGARAVRDSGLDMNPEDTGHKTKQQMNKAAGRALRKDDLDEGAIKLSPEGRRKLAISVGVDPNERPNGTIITKDGVSTFKKKEFNHTDIADGPWKDSPETVTDKSGAKHDPMSRAKDLARRAAAKKRLGEEVEHIDNEAAEDESYSHLKKADKAKKDGNMLDHYKHKIAFHKTQHDISKSNGDHAWAKVHSQMAYPQVRELAKLQHAAAAHHMLDANDAKSKGNMKEYHNHMLAHHNVWKDIHTRLGGADNSAAKGHEQMGDIHRSKIKEEVEQIDETLGRQEWDSHINSVTAVHRKAGNKVVDVSAKKQEYTIVRPDGRATKTKFTPSGLTHETLGYITPGDSADHDVVPADKNPVGNQKGSKRGTYINTKVTKKRT